MSSSERITLEPQQVLAAREWIADCGWGDLEPEDVAGLSDAEIAAGVARHYDGGVASFVADFACVGYLGRGL